MQLTLGHKSLASTVGGMHSVARCAVDDFVFASHRPKAGHELQMFVAGFTAHQELLAQVGHGNARYAQASRIGLSLSSGLRFIPTAETNPTLTRITRMDADICALSASISAIRSQNFGA